MLRHNSCRGYYVVSGIGIASRTSCRTRSSAIRHRRKESKPTLRRQMFPVSFRKGAGLGGDRKPRTRSSCSSNAHDQALPEQVGVKTQVEGKERSCATVVVAVILLWDLSASRKLPPAGLGCYSYDIEPKRRKAVQDTADRKTNHLVKASSSEFRTEGSQ